MPRKSYNLGTNPQDAVTQRQPTKPQPPADAPTHPEAMQPSRKRGFQPGNKFRRTGVLIGKAKLQRLKRERVIAQALAGVDPSTPALTSGKRIEPREFFQQILDDVTAAPTERRDAAKQLAAIDARTDAVQAVEEINWDNLTSAQRRQGIDACKLLTDLRHISHKRDPEFGMV